MKSLVAQWCKRTRAELKEVEFESAHMQKFNLEIKNF